MKTRILFLRLAISGTILFNLLNQPRIYTGSDPTAKVQNLIIKISRKLIGAGATLNPDGSTSISLSLTSGEDAGKSLTMEFSNIPSSGSSGLEKFKPGPLPFYY
jgi:hypothetical protein